MIQNILRKRVWSSLLLKPIVSFSNKAEFKHMLEMKQYRTILGLKENDDQFTDGKGIHKAYLTQIKRYHSDIAHDQITKMENEEISKCITRAYEELKKNSSSYNKGLNMQDLNPLEDEVSEKLFGKKYVDIKHTLYSSGNQQMRAQFIEELSKRRSPSSDNNKKSERTSHQSSSQGQPEGSAGKGIGLVLVLCLGCIPFFVTKDSGASKKITKDGKQISLEEQAKELKVKEYTEAQLDKIHLNTQKIMAIPHERFLNQLSKRRPHMLSYPTDRDFDIFEQLLKFSIAPDIHLYQIPSKYFITQENVEQLHQQNNDSNIDKYQLTQTKPNTVLSMSLEAERSLQNIYVKVDHVLDEIKQTGRYTPPAILMKFKGYLMFKVRDKMFSNLINYRNTSYISLFDLYFDFYSPIFFKRSYFNMYLVGLDSEQPRKNTRYFGNVQLNRRKLPSVFLEKGQKVVVMNNTQRSYDKFNRLKDSELFYRETWQDYYKNYEKKWKSDSPHQKPTQSEF